MNCSYCKFSYCWYCSQNYSRHSFFICFLNLFFRYGIILLSILGYILYQIWISTMILQYLGIFFLSTLFPLSIILQTILFNDYLWQKRSYQRIHYKPSNMALYVIAAICLGQIGLVSLYYYLDLLFETVPIILGVELALLFLAFILYAIIRS